MATSVTYNGNSYSVPAYNDTGYAQGSGNLSSYLVALATGSLTLAGGTFTLTADANFGGSFGLVALYLKSVSANIATAGFIRMAVTDLIEWRNNLNNGNLTLAVDGSNNLTWNASIVALTSGWAGSSFLVTTAGGVLTTLAPPILTVFGGTGSAATLNNNRVMQSSGGAIVEATAITASRALVSDANGIPVASATTSTELGFVSGLTSAIQTQINNIEAGTIGRNRIVNPEMTIDQRKAGSAYTINSTLTSNVLDAYAVRGTSAAGVYTVQQSSSTPPTGFQKFTRLTVTTASAAPAAGDRYEFQQRMEGTFVRDMLFGTANAKQFTLSFWVRSSLTGTFSIGFLNAAINRNFISSYTINSANTWEQKTITITGDTTGTWVNDTTDAGLYVLWDLGSGSTQEGAAGAWQAGFLYRTSGRVRLISTNAATLDITGVQLELGAIATPFEYRPYAVDFLMCQRYYQKFGGRSGTEYIGVAQCTSATAAQAVIEFPVMLRATPSVTVTAPTTFAILTAAGGVTATTAVSGNTPLPQSVVMLITVAAGMVAGNASVFFANNVGSFIEVSADL